MSARCWVACGLLLLWVDTAGANEPGGFAWLPGDARTISHASSASRDTAALEAELAPRFAVTLGAEPALFGWDSARGSLRVGLSAFFGVESRTRSRRLFPAPGGDSELWRGLLGYELGYAWRGQSLPALGPRGALELSLGYYHESDHHTASNAVTASGVALDGADLRGRPEIGNYLATDVSARLALASLELILRQEAKLFTQPSDRHYPFVAGTGEELVLELPGICAGVTPFWSSRFDALLAREARSTRAFRSLLGVALPGRHGELRLFVSFDSGSGKGLLISERASTLGAGLRYVPFAER